MIQFGCLIVICAFKLSIRVNFTKQIWQAKGFCLEWTTKCLLSREIFWKFFKQTSHWNRPELCTKGSWNRNKFLGSLLASKLQFWCLVVMCAFKLSIRVNLTKQIWQAKGFCLEWTTKCLLSRKLSRKFLKQTSHWKRPEPWALVSWNYE